MGDEIITKKRHELGDLGFAGVPAIISAAGKKASFRFIEFFTANIRNPNTRVSYGRAVHEFCQWCEDCAFQLEDLNPVSRSPVTSNCSGFLPRSAVAGTRSPP